MQSRYQVFFSLVSVTLITYIVTRLVVILKWADKFDMADEYTVAIVNLTNLEYSDML